MMNSNFDWYKWDLKWTQGSSFQCWVHTMLSFHWFDSSNSLWRLMQNDFKPSKRPVKVLKFVLYAVLLSKKLLIRGWWLLSIIYVLGPYSVRVNSCSLLSQGFNLKNLIWNIGLSAERPIKQNILLYSKGLGTLKTSSGF